MPISLLWLSQDSPAISPNPVPSHDPWGNLGSGPTLQGEPERAGPQFPDSFDRAQFKDSLSILYNLVFELRQEVVDLHFRLQATDVKVVSFLQILSAMHE
jgi:hypothetical protein